jgi:tRNA (cmo5U34)-methyltransferase
VSEWSELDSDRFLDLGSFFVPERGRQASLVAALVPRLPDADLVVDLCCGEGLLAAAILGAQPEARVLGLDGSPAMRAAAERRLAAFTAPTLLPATPGAELAPSPAGSPVGPRFETGPCELRPLTLPALPPLRAIVSSLALHHVLHADKPAFYAALRALLAPGGALVVADLVAPANPHVANVMADGWDDSVRAADAAAGARGRAWEEFAATRWNLFRYPDPVDHPAPLAQELDWLRGAGFTGVDVAWADRGHAVFAGYRAAADPAP